MKYNLLFVLQPNLKFWSRSLPAGSETPFAFKSARTWCAFGQLRRLGKPIYISAWPFRTLLAVFPLILAGCQFQFYLQKTIGRKAEILVNFVLGAVFVRVLFTEYQYVLAPQAGLPPLSRKMIPEALRRRLPFG